MIVSLVEKLFPVQILHLPHFTDPLFHVLFVDIATHDVVADGPWSSERYEWFGWKNLRQFGIVFNQVEIPLQNRWYVAEDRMPIADEDAIWIFFLLRLILEQIVSIQYSVS